MFAPCCLENPHLTLAVSPNTTILIIFVQCAAIKQKHKINFTFRNRVWLSDSYKKKLQSGKLKAQYMK